MDKAILRSFLHYKYCNSVVDFLFTNRQFYPHFSPTNKAMLLLTFHFKKHAITNFPLQKTIKSLALNIKTRQSYRQLLTHKQGIHCPLLAYQQVSSVIHFSPTNMASHPSAIYTNCLYHLQYYFAASQLLLNACSRRC